MADKIIVEFLDDGNFKLTTDAVSGPNHANAETLFREIATQAGGKVTRRRRVDIHAMLHAHEHAHAGHGHSH